MCCSCHCQPGGNNVHDKPTQATSQMLLAMLVHARQVAMAHTISGGVAMVEHNNIAGVRTWLCVCCRPPAPLPQL